MPQKLRRSWLALAGLIPCLAALSAAALPTPPPPKLPARTVPPLAFDQYGVSYPVIGPQPVVEADFTFQNLGRHELTIDDVEPSCGCLRWHLQGNRRTYRPGERGCLTVRLFTANEQPGPHHYTLTVATRGERPQREVLTFRVTLPDRKVTVDPPEVYFYQLHGRTDTRTVYVTDHRQEGAASLRILAAECRSKHIEVEVGEPEVSASGPTRIPVRLTAAAHVPPGREITYLQLTTDAPDFPRIAVPVLIEGPSRELLSQRTYGPPLISDAPVDIWAILKREADSETSAGLDSQGTERR